MALGILLHKIVTYLDKNPNLAKLYLQYKKKLVKQIIRKPYFIIKNLICPFFYVVALPYCQSVVSITRAPKIFLRLLEA